MLVTENFGANFYHVLRKEHTLVIANADVDGLATCGMLMYAFSSDDATYSLRPVDAWSGIGKAIEEHKEQAGNIVLINCGATRPLSDLNLPDDVTLFVLDSHRPVHLDNIYSRENIKVLVLPSEINDWNVPEASKIYAEDSDNDEDEENEDIATVLERRALKQQHKSNWKRNRAGLLWSYYINNWHAASSAVFMLEIIHDLGKTSAEMMWSAAVGLSSQFTDQLIAVEMYTQICIERMRPFIRKYVPKRANEQGRTVSDDQLKISFDKELTLPLYSHWSLYESLVNDSFFICQSRLWQQKGEQNLKQHLANLGLCRSLQFCRLCQGFELVPGALLFSFSGRTKPLYDRFASAHAILKGFSKPGARVIPSLESGVQKYKIALKSITSLVFLSMNQGHIISTARYFMVNIHQSPTVAYLNSRHCLYIFSHLLLRAFTSAKNTRRTAKPLIVTAPIDGSGDWYLVVGIMPLSEILSDPQRKSVIGRAFEHIAEEGNIEIKRENFDSNIVQIRSNDRAAFFNILETKLELS